MLRSKVISLNSHNNELKLDVYNTSNGEQEHKGVFRILSNIYNCLMNLFVEPKKLIQIIGPVPSFGKGPIYETATVCRAVYRCVTVSVCQLTLFLKHES